MAPHLVPIAHWRGAGPAHAPPQPRAALLALHLYGMGSAKVTAPPPTPGRDCMCRCLCQAPRSNSRRSPPRVVIRQLVWRISTRYVVFDAGDAKQAAPSQLERKQTV